MCLGVPGKVIEVHDDRVTPMATVDFGGAHTSVCLVYVPEAQVGEYVIVHAGFAITVLDEQAALESLRLFDEIAQQERGG